MSDNWRVAKSLNVLLDQLNAKFPNRNKANDGSIGDLRHQQEHSEHNPDANGVVRARDYTHDPVHGLNSEALAQALIASRDPRILYVISNRKIANSKIGWTWRSYSGSNPHDHHCHLSVVSDPTLYDDTRPWDAVNTLGTVTSPTVKPNPIEPTTHAFRSLVPNGYFCATPYDTKINTSVRTNNPGAINGNAAWVKAYPGYAGSKITSDTSGIGGGPNPTAIFETPEYGVAAWWQLMANYRAAGATTVGQIIRRYGGGQDYSAYINFVTGRTGLNSTSEVKLTGDDDHLLKFAKAMFRYEADFETPLHDDQIIYGFGLGRNKGKVMAAAGGGSVIIAGGGAIVAAHQHNISFWIIGLIAIVCAGFAFAVWKALRAKHVGDAANALPARTSLPASEIATA